MPSATDHAREQARAQAESIAEMVAALECDYARLEELRDEREALAADVKHADAEEREQAATALAEWDEENAEELQELTTAAGDCEGRDDATQRIDEDPLSVEVRSGWVSIGGDMQPEEFCILLCTGGPAVRIRGELNGYCQPSRAWLEYQDWGTPWTEYHGPGAEQSTLITYCEQFYFGA